MIEKKFILNADDFGLTPYHNQAVLEGSVNGFLTSASLCANGNSYDNAIHDILPDCPNLSVGVHLNIMEGKSLTGCNLLTDKNGYFNIDYISLILKQNNKTLLEQIEKEFRAQIERIISEIEVFHIDSHVHTHAIPAIFEITCKLAKEYNIPYVRTQHEELYFIPKLQKHINISYPINLIKIALLQYFTKKNRRTIDKYDLKTNDFILGVGYTGMMDADAIEYGLQNIQEESITEALIHPCKYTTSTKDSHTKEFAITQNLNLKETITRMGFEITNYKTLNQ